MILRLLSSDACLNQATLLGDAILLECDSLLVLPASVLISLVLSAGDVIHAIALPTLGVKADAIPGRLHLLASL